MTRFDRDCNPSHYRQRPVGYDVENGEIKVSLNRENLTESVRELKMADNKIPFSFQDDSMFFVKKETENGNSINFIWELHE